MIEDQRPLAVITGASSGIGYELAKLAAEDGYDLVIAADEPSIVEAQSGLEQHGTRVESLQVDLSTTDGVDKLLALIGERPVDALMANAGRAWAMAFSTRIGTRLAS
jgi:short-subunit dehydrogenase